MNGKAAKTLSPGIQAYWALARQCSCPRWRLACMHHAQPILSFRISYFFSCSDGCKSHSFSKEFPWSLACQMWDQKIEYAAHNGLLGLVDASDDLDTGVLDFLFLRQEANKEHYLVLDGLDDCDYREVQAVDRDISQLREKRTRNFKILCASHPELEKQLFGRTSLDYEFLVTEAKVKPVMQHYIATVLDGCLREEQLKLGDRSLLKTISKALEEDSKGMQMWHSFFNP